MSDRFKFRVWDGEKFIFNVCIDCDGEVFTVDRKGNETFLTDAKILQSTGLRDKNGKLIFEGDIVRSDKNMLFFEGYEIRDVFFKDGCFQIGNVDLFTVVDSFNPKVIGNIYENPELLDKKVEK